MEVRWAPAFAKDLSNGGQAFASQGLAGTSMASSNRYFCFSSSLVSMTSSNGLFGCEEWSTRRKDGMKGFHLGAARNEKAARQLLRIGNKLLRHGLGSGDRVLYGLNDALKLSVVQALSSSNGGDGVSGSDLTQRTKATSSDSPQQPSSPAASTSSNATNTPLKKRQSGFLAPILKLPSSIWRQVVLPLSNFGFGKSSIWEGGVGLFVISGAVLLAVTLIWVKGTLIRSKFRRYDAIIEFSKAQGITVGTPVRIRGVDVGSVVGMNPSLERIDVVVRVTDAGIVIPRNALVEVNQSGLISETLIDITPRLPLPRPTVGPLEKGCSEEGLIVCDKERIKGVQGVSLDELVGICTKIARQMDDLGVTNMYDMAERVTAAIDEAKPLLAKVEILAGDIEPLLKELKDGFLLKDLEKLTKVMTEAGDDLRVLNKSVLTAENTDLLRQSVSTLTKTLQHVESISQDVSGLTGDARTKKNLRQLIESLSRLVKD